MGRERQAGCSGGWGRALTLGLALALWPQGLRAQGLCALKPLASEGAPPADGVRWALAGGGGAVGVVDLGDGPRWLRALHARAGAPLLLWRTSRRTCDGCAPQWLEGRAGYVLAARHIRRLEYFLHYDTMYAIIDERNQNIPGIKYRNLQLSSAAPIVMAISRKPSRANICLLNSNVRLREITDRIKRQITQVNSTSPYLKLLRLKTKPEFLSHYTLRYDNQTKVQLGKIKRRRKEEHRNKASRKVRNQSQEEQQGSCEDNLLELQDNEQLAFDFVERLGGRETGWKEEEKEDGRKKERGRRRARPREKRLVYDEDSFLLKLLRTRHQSFRGVLLREDGDGVTWRGLALDPAPWGFRVFKWTNGDGDGDERAEMAATPTAILSPDPRGVSIRAAVIRETNLEAFKINGINIPVVGYLIPLLKEIAYWLDMHLAVGIMEFDERYPPDELMLRLETMVMKGEIDLVPQYKKYSAEIEGISTLLDIVSSGETVQHIVLVPFASALPAWSLPLRVFGAGVWGALLGTAAAYALAWRVVAGASLAASAAAALRALSSSGGAPQDRVRATPQRLQLAAALLASAVVVAAAYQGRLYDLITNPQRHAEIDTFDQLTQENMTLLIHKTLFSKRIQELAPNIPTRDLEFSYSSCNPITTFKKEERLAIYFTSNIWRKFGTSVFQYLKLYRPMRQNVVSYQPHMVSRRNWPWSEKLKLLILQMEDNGLVLKWKDDFKRTYAIYLRSNQNCSTAPQQLDDDDGPKELGMEDVIAHFYLHFAGLSASALVFCAELWHGLRAGEHLFRSSQRIRAQLGRRGRRLSVQLRRYWHNMWAQLRRSYGNLRAQLARERRNLRAQLGRGWPRQ